MGGAVPLRAAYDQSAAWFSNRGPGAILAQSWLRDDYGEPMPQHIFKTIQACADGGRVTVTMGYDRPLDYVFLLVEDHESDILYSNLGDPHAGTEQRSVDYYRPILKGLGITLPESMFRSGA